MTNEEILRVWRESDGYDQDSRLLDFARTLVSQAYEESARKLLARHDGAPVGHDVYADAEAIRALKDSLQPETASVSSTSYASHI